ncbi:hypothetical protein SAY87_007935 [Trapa incisa]|uniref:Protein RDM1 n=1 Tax=Trapa incisa TaxID=236973 RepID=A0AAN7QG50_9MYRT|nr:hypothetical protein SAY87_007935 [Trapa incisa]
MFLTMKRPRACDGKVDFIPSEKSPPSDVEVENFFTSKYAPLISTVKMPLKELSSEERLLQKAEMYQLYMKEIPVPSERCSAIPCYSWTELGKSLKILYRQPLHYLTNIQLKQWDQAKMGTEDEDQPLDGIIHPIIAEATIWLNEEVHRRSTSHQYLARLWQDDPLHQAYIDSVVPEIYSEDP